MLKISSRLQIPLGEIEIHYVTAQGAGGQNVNKVATAAHLRFDIKNSSLPEEVRQRLLDCHDQRITADGILVIKAQAYRSQERNRDDALKRLAELIKKVATPAKKRKPTKPTASSRIKRLDNKGRRSQTKALRGKVRD